MDELTPSPLIYQRGVYTAHNTEAECFEAGKKVQLEHDLAQLAHRPDREELRENIREAHTRFRAKLVPIEARLNTTGEFAEIELAENEFFSEILSLEPSGREDPDSEEIAELIAIYDDFHGGVTNKPYRKYERELAKQIKALFRSEEEIKQEERERLANKIASDMPSIGTYCRLASLLARR